jgi:hypothetical protein
MNQFFYEDQVYKVDKKGVKFGLVVENEVSFQFSTTKKDLLRARKILPRIFLRFFPIELASFHKFHNVIIDLTFMVLSLPRLFEGS